MRLYFIAYNLIGFSSITVVDADNDAHGKYLLSFQNLSGIYNKRRGEYVPLAGIFLRKLLRFCLSRLAIGSQNRTASGENSRCNKKAHPAFRQDARKIACGYFQANGINLVHFAPKSPVFLQFYIVATTQNQSMGFIVGNSSTSRIDALSVSSMTRRSTPKPRPPVGGRPYSRALT